MNKDLPIIIRKVFADLDPLIWKGIWLYTLETLLNDPRMLCPWEEFVVILKHKHAKGSNLQLNQYMKWELKAFVAQAVNSVNKNYNNETFIAEFEKYFSKKGYNINRDIINEIYQIINN